MERQADAKGGYAVTVHEKEELVSKGIRALDHKHTHLALVCFERASAIGSSATISSGLGYCLAAARGEIDRGLVLCREAVSQEPDRVFLYRNLGNVLLLAGKSNEAIEVFRAGLRIGKDDNIIRKLDSLGTRKPPMFKSLGRKHLLNRIFGLLSDRLGFR